MAVGVAGYRLFFPGACLVAALWLPVWLLGAYGGLPLLAPFQGPFWHIHEILFGFVPAMFAGFLTLTQRGPAVLAAFALWLAGRLALLAAALLPPVLVAALDIAFLPVLGAVLLPRLRQGGSRFMPVMTAGCMVLLAAANLWAYLGVHGIAPGGMLRPLYAGAIIEAALLAALGGRLVRSYLRSFLGRTRMRVRGAEQTGLAVAGLALAAWLAGAEWVAGGALIALGAVQLIRLVAWWEKRISGEPLLSSVTAGFLWLGLSLVLWGSGHAAPNLGPSAGLHLLLIGSLGPIAAGMAVRLTRARSGRTAQAGPLPVLAFWLLTLAGLLATAWFLAPVGAMQGQAVYVLSLVAAAWALAYLILGVVLLRDGRPVPAARA